MIHLRYKYQSNADYNTLGEALHYYRNFKGLSTRELAEKVSAIPATIVLYKNDKHPIKYKTTVALAWALNIYRKKLLDEYAALVDYPYQELLQQARKEISLTQMQIAMKKTKRILSFSLALLMGMGVFLGLGTTVFATSSQMTAYMG